MPKTEVFDKELVLNQAIAVFHEKGYNATSMQDLVDATGLNRSSIYNSFGNKLSLYLLCLKSYQEKYKVATEELLLKIECPLQSIESIFELYLNDILTDKQHKGCLITNCKSEMANQDSTIQHFLKDIQLNTLALFEDLIDQGQKLKMINTNKSVSEYALYLFSSIQGFRMTGILINDKSQLKSLIKTTLQNLN